MKKAFIVTLIVILVVIAVITFFQISDRKSITQDIQYMKATWKWEAEEGNYSKGTYEQKQSFYNDSVKKFQSMIDEYRGHDKEVKQMLESAKQYCIYAINVIHDNKEQNELNYEKSWENFLDKAYPLSDKLGIDTP